MKIMVTGSTGLIGSYLIPKLLEKQDVEQVFKLNRSNGKSYSSINGDRETSVFCDLNNITWTEDVMRVCQPDIVFHLAAEQNGKKTCLDNNINSTHNLLKFCPAGCRFVNASSSTIYGGRGQHELCYEYHKPTPTSPYGLSKMIGESMVDGYTALGKVCGANLRFCAIISLDRKTGAVADIIRKIQGDGEAIDLWGNKPGSIKPYIHISDCIDAILRVGFSDLCGTWNCSANNNISILTIAETIMEVMNRYKDIQWDNGKVDPTDNNIVAMSNLKMLNDFKWAPTHLNSKDAIRAIAEEIT